jgi:hypothetical protein
LENSIFQNWDQGGPDTEHVDNFSARWTAELEAPYTGTYTFITRSDDGNRLWINDQLICNDFVNHVPRNTVGDVNLVAGQTYLLVMEYYEAGGGALAVLRWEGPNIQRQVIPAGPLKLPRRAMSPNPTNGAVDVKQTPKLQWKPGYGAIKHNVYFGTTLADVNAANIANPLGVLVGQDQDPNSYSPGTLEWNTTYYWRIDEVNTADTESPWKGRVWSFTTADFFIVDDFEDYNNFTPDRVFQHGWTE